MQSFVFMILKIIFVLTFFNKMFLSALLTRFLAMMYLYLRRQIFSA
ncbi:Uncharacterised protein [Sphingobacterium spiritivorum]|uniref:Uncharacterized protein n=1 Tax=Sphingobacterium spiritivorum TaxID=258 RepID=A0A380BC24_SPHSI|nr:Uncharacterised protein [Sphingobacterium spiritivorum]